MDFKKIINAAKVPTIVLFVLGVAGTVIGLLLYTLLQDFGILIGAAAGACIFAIQCIVIGWAGYSAVKKYQLDLLSATLTGTFASVISNVTLNVVTSLISFVILLAAYLTSARSNATGTAAGGAVGGIVALAELAIVLAMNTVFWGVISLVVGIVFGVLGGFIAQITKPKEKPIVDKPKQA